MPQKNRNKVLQNKMLHTNLEQYQNIILKDNKIIYTKFHK